ncbi:MAG: VacJ family lipoprotein, partial [Halieaceae bacterium]|nr:VacJ family lipoprotein [Halieaceae bacterium]
ADPWESYNRKVHAFNTTVDRCCLRPVARGYNTITPGPVKDGVANFFRNIDWPVTFLNQLLQGKIRESGVSTGRFVLNTTFGVLGLFDPASGLDIPQYDEDFGQTLAAYGWEDSRYFVFPILGPSTLRDTLGQGFYGYFHPVSYMIREHDDYRPLIVDVVQVRASFLPRDAELEDAYDPYVLLRDVYLQNRRFEIYDGAPPLEDYESLLE